MLAAKSRDSRSDLITLREDGHMFAALDREQFRPGYPGRERLRVLGERHQAVARAMHDQDRNCDLFQWVRGGPRHRDVVVRRGQPKCRVKTYPPANRLLA